jgi:hypothetical protein
MRDSGYELFLSAPLWEETGGAPLSVMSAFARLGLEPWGEADRLGRLPRHRAVSALSTSLSELPINGISLPNYAAIAARLVELLPQFNVIGKGEMTSGASRRSGVGVSWWWLIAAGGVLLALQIKGWLF